MDWAHHRTRFSGVVVHCWLWVERFSGFSAGGCANALEKPLKRFSLHGRAQAPAEAEAGC